MNLFDMMKKGVGVFILTLLFSPVWGMEKAETSAKGDQPAPDVVKTEVQDKGALEGTAGCQQARDVVKTEVPDVDAELARKIQKRKEKREKEKKELREEIMAEVKAELEAYTDSVAAVVNGRDPVVYQAITGNKLLLGIGVCSAVGFFSNVYCAYCETGSIFWGVLRASKESLRDFVTYYYGAKIIEQAGVLTTRVVSMAPKKESKKER